MNKSKKRVDLPLLEPLYSTYHYQGICTAATVNNPSLRNRELNQVIMLTCNRKFLHGFTTPEITVKGSAWSESPYFERKFYGMQFLEGKTNFVIKRLLDAGYYVSFEDIDDYYVEGKSWYGKRHFSHDGCICGYDEETKSFCLYAYDQNWIYQKFWTSQKSFDTARKAQFKRGMYGGICGIKPKEDQITFSPSIALSSIAEYLDSDLKKYPEEGEGNVFGIVVHDYIAKYVRKLFDGSVPYERMDRRVFRMIWEHKKVMLERIALSEDALSMDHAISESYRSVVREADNCRMLYAAHHMKQKNAVLPIIHKKLLSLKEKEQELLTELLEKSKEEKEA